MLRGLRSLIGQIRSPKDDFGMRVANAGIWAFMMRSITRGAQLIRVVILGRLLSPNDFGLMAIATITLGLLEVFSQTGFRHALVQRTEDVDDALDTAWSVEVLRGIAVSLIVLLAAPLIAIFYDQPDAVAIVRVMASVALINGFTNMAIVRFDKELRFDKVFRFQLAERLTQVVVSIAIAVVWPTVWALVIGAIAGSIARVTASFILAPRRPHFEIVKEKAKELGRYGRWIYGTNVLFYLTSEVDDILVGRKLGTDQLGLYRMSFIISQSVVTEVVQTINQVMFPAFSMIQQSKDRMIAALTNSTHLVAFVGFPLTAIFVVAGEELVGVLLGDAWLAMVPALKILAVAGAVRTLTSLSTIMFEGAGEPHLSTRFAALKLAALLVTIFPLIDRYGIEGAALSSLIAASVVVVPIVVKVRSYSPRLFGRYVHAVAWPVGNTLVMAGAMVAAQVALQGASYLVALLSIIALGGAAYVAAVAVSARFLGYREPRDAIAKLKNRSAVDSDDSEG